jgi:hypothetical protein
MKYNLLSANMLILTFDVILSFVYKKESSWPPPPMNGRIGATVEYLISVVNLNVDIDSWGVFVSFMIGAWEV